MLPDGGRLGAFLAVTSRGAARVETPVTRRSADGEQRHKMLRICSTSGPCGACVVALTEDGVAVMACRLRSTRHSDRAPIPSERTFSESVGMSQRCQYQKWASLFNHFVGCATRAVDCCIAVELPWRISPITSPGMKDQFG
jgi:hypothetical protein